MTDQLLWGWDDGSILFVAAKDIDKAGWGNTAKRLQDYPELMAQVIALCETFFAEPEHQRGE